MTPPQILEAAKTESKFYCDTDNEVWIFKRGVKWLFNHLCELAEQRFDEREARSASMKMPALKAEGYIKGRKDQHTLDMAALLKAREEISQLRFSRCTACGPELEAAKQELLVVKAQREKAIATEGNLNILIGETRSRVKSLEVALQSAVKTMSSIYSNGVCSGGLQSLLELSLKHSREALKGDGSAG